MVVLGGVAVSYERGTPVRTETGWDRETFMRVRSQQVYVGRLITMPPEVPSEPRYMYPQQGRHVC